MEQYARVSGQGSECCFEYKTLKIQVGLVLFLREEVDTAITRVFEETQQVISGLQLCMQVSLREYGVVTRAS